MDKVLIAALLAFAASALAQGKPPDDDMEEKMEALKKKVVQQGKVCPDPARPCRHSPDFGANELSFAIKTKFGFDRGQDRSQPFYGVILRSDKLCSITEEERLKLQAMFPSRKVFVHQFQCGGFHNKVTYTNSNRTVGFIGVYAGETEEQARRFLAEVKAAGRFADANYRRMHAVIVYQLE